MGLTIANGRVYHYVEEEDGLREEWSEPLCESPVRELFSEWIWDLTVDPRKDTPE